MGACNSNPTQDEEEDSGFPPDIDLGEFDVSVKAHLWFATTLRKVWNSKKMAYVYKLITPQTPYYYLKTSAFLNDKPEFGQRYSLVYRHHGRTRYVIFAELHSKTIPFTKIKFWNGRFDPEGACKYYYSQTRNRPYIIVIGTRRFQQVHNIKFFDINDNFANKEYPFPIAIQDPQTAIDRINGKLYISSKQLFCIFDLERLKFNFIKMLNKSQNDFRYDVRRKLQ